VLELTQVIAGPFAGVALADLGADVVKLEPPGGESTRQSGGFIPGESKGYHAFNRGKRSLVIDLGKPDGQALIHRIIPGFDVFFTNSRPGVPERLHIDYDTLRQYRPDLIYLHNTGFGQRGPNAARAGSDIVAQAFTGMMALDAKLDEFDAPVAISGVAPSDYLAAAGGAMAICAALFHRERTGQGQRIDTSLVQAGLAVQGASAARLPAFDSILAESSLADFWAAKQRGASYRERLEAKGSNLTAAFRLYYGGFNAKDGAIILGCLTPANREQARRALGITDDPTADRNFNALDRGNDAVCAGMHARIRAILATKTVAEWIAILEEEGVPCSNVNFPEDVADEPQVIEMGYMLDLDHELTGPERMAGPLSHMSLTPTGAKRAAPPLGWHTAEVLREHGLQDEEINALEVAKVVYFHGS
jgi:crotonobetainyl-CoA:carnitine CoA-transferase CaiB-like acyl-CoA transferase